MIDFYLNHILSILIFLPLIGAIFLLFVNKEKVGFIRNFSLGLTLFLFLLSLPLYFKFDSASAGFQFE